MSDTLRRRNLEVLLVEDNPGDVRLISEILRERMVRCNLNIAHDGDEALDMLRNLDDHGQRLKPDLIVLDLNLPRRDGRELLSELKRDTTLRGVPVIIFTSSNAEQDLLKAYDLQASCYIIKPVGLEQFTNAVAAIGDFWLNVVSFPRSA